MKLIFGNPGSGKTKALLALSEKNNVPILAESDARVQRLLVKAEGYGYKIPAPLTFDEFKNEDTKLYQRFRIVTNAFLFASNGSTKDTVQVNGAQKYFEWLEKEKLLATKVG